MKMKILARCGQVGGRIRLIAGAEREVEKLQSNFMAIQAVLTDAESRHFREIAVRDWLDKYKDISYDIEDALDEWNSKILLNEAENMYASKPLKKVRSVIPNYLGCRSLVLRHKIVIRITDLDRKLDIIAVEKERFNFRSITDVSEEVEPQITTSADDFNQFIYGRSEDTNRIVDLLLSKSSQQEVLPIISIVGMGGLGKTTLAQLVFNDDKVSTHFDKNIWVCVSKPFDELRIAKVILESLTNSAPDLNELETVMRNISQHINGKKFLLILDDVWTENPKDWDQLKHSLRFGSPESRILMTTRKENVANVIGTTTLISLGTLSDDLCWALFSRIALFGETCDEYNELSEISRKIFQKCKGLPLAVTTLASVLRNKRKFDEWQNILESEIWELEEVEQELFRPLLLSYYDLPSLLKKCFLYCAIFPKDYEIKREQLIRLWMAQGYVRSPNKDMELVGEEYFETLAMCSFFQDFRKDENNISIRSCKMHDIVHDFAPFVAQNEFDTMEVDGTRELELPSSYDNVRHLMMKIQEGASFPSSIYTRNIFLRSLVVECNHCTDPKIVMSKLVDQFTCLRSLYLKTCSIEELPVEIRKLIHLRYLNLSHNVKIEKLPETLYELYHLQTLDLSWCSLEEIQEGIKKLIHLRYLNLSHNVKLEKLPGTLYELYHLQTLDLSWCSVEEIQEGIKKLRHLRYLNLSHNVKIEKLPETLCELDYLQTLDVTNCYWLQKLPQGLGKLVNLKQLRNHGTPLSYMPRGIQRLAHLQQRSKFVVSNVSNDKACSLGRLENLKELGGFLMISGLGNVSDVGELNKAKLKDKTNLCGLGLRFDGWMFAEDEGIFKDLQPPPNLQELVIQYYTGRTMTPEWIQSLTKLRVLKLSSCFELEDLPALGKLSELESLMIWNMTSVKKVDNNLLGIQSGDNSSSSSSLFPKLTDLAMWSMEEWEEWEESDFDVTSIMPCLQSLKISSCPKLKALPNYIIRQTPRLEKLEIKNCGILEQRYNKKTGQDCSKVSHIPGFLIMDESQSSTSLLTVDSENSAEMESRIQDKGSKGKMPIDFSTATMGSDPQTSNSA